MTDGNMRQKFQLLLPLQLVHVSILHGSDTSFIGRDLIFNTVLCVGSDLTLSGIPNLCEGYAVTALNFFCSHLCVLWAQHPMHKRLISVCFMFSSVIDFTVASWCLVQNVAPTASASDRICQPGSYPGALKHPSLDGGTVGILCETIIGIYAVAH